MAYTIIGYSDTATGATIENVSALADPHVRVSGDDIVVPELNKVIGVYVLASSHSQARLSSPSLRKLIEPDIEPFDLVNPPLPTDNLPIYDLRERPYTLDVSESLNFQTVASAAGHRSYGIILLSDGKLGPIPSGQITTIRATNTTTLVANVWKNGALTFAQTLPAGRYAIVGMRAQSTTLIAARLVFTGYSWRPGVIGCATDAIDLPAMFRMGGLGVFGEFEHNTPPSVDFLASAGDTSQVVHLDIIKIR